MFAACGGFASTIPSHVVPQQASSASPGALSAIGCRLLSGADVPYQLEISSWLRFPPPPC
eukprot:1047819-Pyramimonas_sp.AAC.1